METAKIKRLEYLKEMLSKYGHCWYANGGPSDRMYKWVDEYNDIKYNNREEFRAFCDKHGFEYSHVAQDSFA